MMKNAFDDLLSFKEASIIWNIDDSVLRHAVNTKRFEINVDVKKFGKQWVVTRQAMTRIFGYVPKDCGTRFSKEKMQAAYFYVSKLANDYAKQEKISNKQSMSIFSKHGMPEFIFDCFDYYEHCPFDDILKEITTKIRTGFNYVR